MNPATEFLTPEECAEVDKALLTSHDKFSTRVAIYALRSLKAIAQQENLAIAELQPHQIEDWIYQDTSLQNNPDLAGVDDVTHKFRQFFFNLVLSSTRPLNQMANELGIEIEQLTIPQVIAWFEAKAKHRLQNSN